MINTLTNFEKLIQEHEVIQANTRLISGSADNLLILSSLRDNIIDYTNYQVNYLSDRRVNLKRAISSLRDGLIDHNAREEAALQSLVGDRILQSIKKDHRVILEKIAEIDWILLNVSPLGILFNSAFLKQKIDDLCKTLYANCVQENSVLELLLKIPSN